MVYVFWRGNRYLLDFPPNVWANLTLSQLKRRCAFVSGVKLSRMQLFYRQVLLTGEDALATSLGLRHEANIAMEGSTLEPLPTRTLHTMNVPTFPLHSPAPPTPPVPQLSPAELAMKKLDAIFQNTETVILPLLEALEVNVRQHGLLSSTDVDTVKARQMLNKSHAHVSELILQQLLHVDGVEGGDVVRGERRKMVKRLQSYLERADAAIAEGKQEIVNDNV